LKFLTFLGFSSPKKDNTSVSAVIMVLHSSSNGNTEALVSKTLSHWAENTELKEVKIKVH